MAALGTSGLQFLQLLLLARLLDRADFGCFAIASLFLQVCLQIQDTGINNTILHRQENDYRQLSSLFWMNLLLGVALGTVLWLASGVIAFWYQEPALSVVSRKFALLLPLVGAAATQKVLLQKQMDYRRIGSIEMAASVASFIVALPLAFCGFGLQALLWGAMVRYGVEALLFIVWKPLLQPSFTFQMQDSRFYLRYGLVQTGERFVTMLTSQLDVLLIGKLLGMEVLGVYDVIKRLLVRPSSLLSHVVERVALPLYARIQHRRHVLKKTFLLVLQRLLTVNLFGYGIGMLWAGILVYYFLGLTWLPFVKEFRLVAVLVLIHCLLNPVDSLLVAMGKIHWWFWSNLVLMPLLAIGILVGCQFGLEGAVLSQIIVLGFFCWVIFEVLLRRIFRPANWEYLTALKNIFSVTWFPLFLASVGWYLKAPVLINFFFFLISFAFFIKLSKSGTWFF